MTYVHELKDWPKFRWDEQRLLLPLVAVRHRQGRLIGRLQGLGVQPRNEATLNALTQDVLKSSEIEGELLDIRQVRRSIAHRLGIDTGAPTPADRHVDGVVEMTLDATQNCAAPLTTKRLFGWHAALFPTGQSGLSEIRVGKWRDGRAWPTRVASGYIGRERVRYEAPAAARVAREMAAFLRWFNDEGAGVEPVLKAAVAHLWLVIIHPFEDGNGPIARAIADMALARSEQSPQRFYSMSAQIRLERQAYYDILEATQKGDLDITAWLEWFLACLDRAFGRADEILEDVLRKARFWQAHAGVPFNDRQRDMLVRLLDGLEGKLTSSKWARIEKCSQDTALRDIEGLLTRGVLAKEPAGGRSTSYSLLVPAAGDGG